MPATTKSKPQSVDFRRYIVRKNPFAASLARTGIRIAKGSLAAPNGRPKAMRPPSKESLREIPAVDMRRARVRTNPYASRILAGDVVLRVGRGRPERGQEVGRSTVRSVRLPERVWKAIERTAKRQRTTVHALLRATIAQLAQGER
jgi:hypothetical protein